MGGINDDGMFIKRADREYGLLFRAWAASFCAVGRNHGCARPGAETFGEILYISTHNHCSMKVIKRMK
jgi:hypothetical protein